MRVQSVYFWFVLSSQGVWIASFVLPQNKAFSTEIAAFVAGKQNIFVCEYIRFIFIYK